MSNLAVFNVPVLGTVFFAGKIKNKSTGEYYGGFTGSYNGKTKEYKITYVFNVKDT
jgi:hypothetical protein